MRNIIKILFCLLMFSLSACGAKETAEPAPEAITEEMPVQETVSTDLDLKEMSGTYLLESMLVNGEEAITDQIKEAQKEYNTYFKMTILENGDVFIDFVSSQGHGCIKTEKNTVLIGGTDFPFVYENGRFTIDASVNDYMYYFVKDETLDPVIMYYRNAHLVLEDPYLLPWVDANDDDENSLFLFSMDVWLSEHTYDKTDESEECKEALDIFAVDGYYEDLSEGIHFNETENAEGYRLDVLFVTQTKYHWFRMWCLPEEKEKYSDIMYELMQKHVLILEWYQQGTTEQGH